VVLPIQQLSQVRRYSNTKGNGDLYMWGANGSGQLGSGDTITSFTPKKVIFKSMEESPKLVFISCGSEHNAVIDGNLKNNNRFGIIAYFWRGKFRVVRTWRQREQIFTIGS
jgi:hypothetical protein